MAIYRLPSQACRFEGARPLGSVPADAEIIRQESTHLGFCDASGLGAGVVRLDLARTGQNLVWPLPWHLDAVTSLVSSTNPQGKITNSDIDLAALILQEATLPEAVPKDHMAAPHSGSDNTPTVS